MYSAAVGGTDAPAVRAAPALCRSGVGLHVAQRHPGRRVVPAGVVGQQSDGIDGEIVRVADQLHLRVHVVCPPRPVAVQRPAAVRREAALEREAAACRAADRANVHVTDAAAAADSAARVEVERVPQAGHQWLGGGDQCGVRATSHDGVVLLRRTRRRVHLGRRGQQSGSVVRAQREVASPAGDWVGGVRAAGAVDGDEVERVQAAIQQQQRARVAQR